MQRGKGMKLRDAILAATLLSIPLAARAQPFQGIYIGAGIGYNMPGAVDVQTRTPTTPRAQLHPDGSLVGLAAVGYGLGNGFRFELEANLRDARVPRVTGTVSAPSSGSLRTYGVMGNALFDMDIGVPWLFPYLGGGVGYARTRMDSLVITPPGAPPTSSRSDGTAGSFAFQAIGGLSFPMPGVPGLSITSEYRFFGVTGNETFSSVANPGAVRQTFTIHHQFNHSFLLGVRYAFGVTPPAMAATAPAAQAVPAPAAARSYLVFFDWDKATLTDRARQIVKEAADNSTHVQYTRIEVNGYTDTSGTPRYNQGLSVRRAQAVAGELVRDGVPKNAISIQGFGETHLLVPTGPGVREPQNRRVEIIIR